MTLMLVLVIVWTKDKISCVFLKVNMHGFFEKAITHEFIECRLNFMRSFVHMLIVDRLYPPRVFVEYVIVGM